MQVSDDKSITKFSSCCCQSSASRPAASCFPCAGPAGGVGPPSWSSAACSAARLAASRFFLDLLLPIGSCSSKAASSRLGVSRGRSHICTQHVRVTGQLPIQIDSLSMQTSCLSITPRFQFCGNMGGMQGFVKLEQPRVITRYIVATLKQ